MGPEDRVTLDESVSIAMLALLASLGPAERSALMMRDVLGLPYDEVSEVLGRSQAACRQLVTRARTTYDSSADLTAAQYVTRALVPRSRELHHTTAPPQENDDDREPTTERRPATHRRLRLEASANLGLLPPPRKRNQHAHG